MEPCPVCQDPLDHDVLTLPGCGHRLHASCALSAAQYDVRCAVCRAVPDGVERRVEQGAVERPSLVIAQRATGEHVVVLQQVWRQYLARRRRAINRSPRARAAARELKEHRATAVLLTKDLNSHYNRLCKEVCKHDPELAEKRKALSKHRRRERRLEKIIEAALAQAPATEELTQFVVESAARVTALEG